VFQIAPLPRTLEAARRDLSSPKAHVRADAAHDLGQQGRTADAPARIELLLGALSDPAPLVRRRAAVSLADLGAEEALPLLVALFADADLRVRQMAVLAVGELAQGGDREVEGRLLGLTRAGDPSIRYQALAALGGLVGRGVRSEILAAALDSDAEVRELCIRLAAEHLVEAGQVAPEVKVLFEQGARDPVARVALAAEIEALELGLDVGVARILDLLAGRLRGSEAADERRAIFLCARRGIEQAVPILTKRAFGWFGFSLDPYRWPVRGALARLGEPRAARAIGRSIEHGRWLARTLAVEAAGEAGLDQFRDSLVALRGRLELVDQDVLEQALSALPEARGG